MSDLALKKSLLSCPGDTIQENLDFIGMSQAEFAERIGRSVPKLNELIKGKAPITKDTATKLEYVLNIPTSFWLNLERAYQDELLEVQRMERLKQFEDWVLSFPLPKLKSLGILPNIRDKAVLAECLLKFFRVASPEQWSKIYHGNSLAFKIELRHTTEAQAISVWLRLGEIQAEQIQVEQFDKKVIRSNLNEFKKISYAHKKNWLDDLQALCSSLGVALVYTPCIAKAPIYGATRWLRSNSTPLIQMTDRYKDYASFWFTFYHELGHILYHGKKDIFIDGLDSIKPDIEKENEADAFASRMLLKDKDRKDLSSYPKFTEGLILDLSKLYNTHPGIIVSQLQRAHKIPYNNFRLNRLKPKVVFKELKLEHL